MSYIVMIEVPGQPRMRVSTETLENARRLYDAVAAQYGCQLTLTGPDGVVMATRPGDDPVKATAKA
ncbi:hypothetical protein ACFFLM_26650 [Deinococcus oregonensis]|uniref:Uncharacterized protein n=1 Tax=Deinococcus oregonensis TaxID=1805970 RepID=A0ABV6B9C6_9DEIO